jgi:hypothetical protein
MRRASFAERAEHDMELTQQQISIRAYHIWEEEGRPHGRDQAHWFEAERQLQKGDFPVGEMRVAPPPHRPARRRR